MTELSSSEPHISVAIIHFYFDLEELIPVFYTFSQIFSSFNPSRVAGDSPFDFNSLTLYHITSFLCELVSPCASIAFVFVVIYKVMDAFAFYG